MRPRIPQILLVLIAGILLFSSSVQAMAQEADEPVVHAILFFSPTCPHCHEAITNVMLPLMEQYGDRLEILGIDVSTETGDYLYNSAITYFEVPENRRGVPTLVYQDTVLVGTLEIETAFPALIEEGLATGGIAWPDIPGLAEVVANLTPTAAPEPVAEATSTATPTATAESEMAIVSVPETAVPTPAPVVETQSENTAALSLEAVDTTTMADTAVGPSPDPVGFVLGWLVLLGLVAVLLFCVWQLVGNWSAWAKADATLDSGKGRAVVMWLLIIIGLIMAGYLAYVETMQVTAVCGPVGECNIVQSSPYAQIFGIPMAVLGLLFYLAVAALWLWQRVDKVRGLAVLGLVVLVFFGSLFSIYLTLLELLVIGAICAWCLTSAVVTGLMFLWVTTGVLKRPLPPD